LHVEIQARVRHDSTITIASDGLETIHADLATLKLDGQMDLAKQVLLSHCPRVGLDIRIQAQSPWSSGLGTSGALGVAMMVIAQELRGACHTPERLAALAAVAEHASGNEGGLQDQYASAHGGARRDQRLGLSR
jgi:galactokinase/mevalonate kinase-like predicted kinase